MNCFNHKDREAVAECRFCSKGLCQECAIALGPNRGTTCSRECESQARAARRQADRRNRWSLLVFGLVGVLMTAGMAWLMARRDGPWLWFLLPFAGGSALLAWFLHLTWWQFRMRFIHGAPFRSGDRVHITAGPHAGREGQVVRPSAGSATRVVVNLTVEDEPLTHHFDWEELKRLQPASKSRSRK